VPNSAITVSGSITGLTSGTFSLSVPQIVGTQATGPREATAIATNTSVTIPSGAVAVVIVPPAGNTNTITAKGASGDTGIIIHLTYPTVIALGSSATLVLNASSATNLDLIWC
jgi:hypothetical protein